MQLLPPSRLVRPTLVLLAAFAGSAPSGAALLNRWSFTRPAGAVASGTAFADTISGASAVVRGQGASASGAAITLPGTTTGNQAPSAVSAYIDLPNGLVSTKTHLTVELWATPLSYQAFGRLFEFGRVNVAGDGLGSAGEITGLATTAPGTTQASDAITLSLNRNGNTLSQQRFEGKLDGNGNTADPAGLFRQVDTNLATTAGTRYHYALVFEAGVGAFAAVGGRLSWYRDGALAATTDVGFRLNQIEDVNNWLGRSLWSADRMAHASFDEVRVYNHALTPTEIAASRTAGPDAVFSPPSAVADAVTIHPGQKARVAVLANDTGLVTASTVAIAQAPSVGTATPDAAGRILYAHPGGDTGPVSFTYTVAGPGGTSTPATVTVTPSNQLRIPVAPLNVPAAPPATAYQLVNALPGLTFTQPLAMVSPPADSRRLFVVEKTGAIKLVPDTTASAPTQSVFLNLATVLAARSETLSTASEQGLLGLAFHPAYATNRQFYVFYSVTKTDGLVYERVSRFLAQTANPSLADNTSELILIEQRDEASNHNGGGLAFGPDGYLYISLGDEGGQNDQYNNSQRIDRDFFSAIARIDVDKKAGSLAPNAHAAVPRDAGVARYAVPPDNPYVGATSFNGLAVTPSAVRTEFWAVGLRNPWRFSFDSANGDLWCADVGQNLYERIDVITRGGNYGWAFREGANAGPKSASAPAGFAALNPLYEYVHGSGTFQGNSVSGGFVYRGSRIPALTGAYVFGDYVSGHIWILRRNGAAAPTVARIAGEGGVVAFAPDPANGDVLLADIDGSRILRLVVGDIADSYPATLSATGLFADVTDLSPAPGLLPYTPNLPFWSDHALKRRWFALPDSTGRFNWSGEDTWGAPAGTVWVKHFDLELTRGQPATKRRLETRLLVRNATGAYGVSYRWNEAQTEAVLVPAEGVSFPVSIVENGIPRIQTWQIPGRAACLVCHTPQAGHALSFNTRQLNRVDVIHGFVGNQIELLHQAGYFHETPPPTNTLPRHVHVDDTAHPIDARVRSYLAVNCAYCHKAGGTAPSAWDGRVALSLAATGLINGAANNNNGDPQNRLVVPGDALHSVVLQRVAASNGFTRMPPLGSTEIDASAVSLLTAWIVQSLPDRESFADWRFALFGSETWVAGAPEADPDGDGATNWAEYLAGTAPLDGTSLLIPRIDHAAGRVTVGFDVPENRTFHVETSTDLAIWTRWDVPGNSGMAVRAGLVELNGPLQGNRRFFRLVLGEN
jgi:glucose/arabinose dehydrogenase